MGDNLLVEFIETLDRNYFIMCDRFTHVYSDLIKVKVTFIRQLFNKESARNIPLTHSGVQRGRRQACRAVAPVFYMKSMCRWESIKISMERQL